jgi:hypothetical protein
MQTGAPCVTVGTTRPKCAAVTSIYSRQLSNPVSVLCLVLQLKWNLPDETGGEMITQYQLKVKPAPPGFSCSQPDEEVRGRA